ncbi:hypothetical protein ACTXT7_001974 [Hymenolepis weldensis]
MQIYFNANFFPRAIVQTYLTFDDMQEFCSLEPNVRKEKFFQLVNLVLGTRVYNFSLGFGAVSFNNLPELTEQTLIAAVLTIDKHLKEMQGYVALSTDLYLKFLASDDNRESQPINQAELLGLSPSLLKDAVINTRQLILYFCQIRNELVEIVDDHQRDKRRLVEILGMVFACLRAGNNPSSEDLQKQIFELAKIWTRFKENMAYIAVITNVLNGLKEFSFKPFAQLNESGILKSFLRTDSSNDDKSEVRQ